jgi:hypothetical protein
MDTVIDVDNKQKQWRKLMFKFLTPALAAAAMMAGACQPDLHACAGQ